MSERSCFTIETGKGYFFNRTKYIRVDNIQIGKSGDFVAAGPTTIPNSWPSLKAAGFDSVDAVLNMGGGTAYFFRGSNYARVDGIQAGKDTDKLAAGPSPIATTWPSLAQAGFETVDAVLSMGGGVAYFFSGTRYIRVKGIAVGKSTDTLDSGPHEIADQWGSLKAAGFYSVDAVLSVGDSIAYFFSGSQYARIEGIYVGKGGDTLAYGPSQVSIEWPSLKHFW